MNDNDPRWQELNAKVAKVQAELERKKLMDNIEQGKRMTCTRHKINTKAIPRISSYQVSASLQEFLAHCNLTTEQAVEIIKETPMTTSEDGCKGTGVDYIRFTNEELPPQLIQYSKVEPEPDNNLPHEHQSHMDFHKSVIDNYEAYKLIEVLTEILDEVRSINKKLSKRKKK